MKHERLSKEALKQIKMIAIRTKRLLRGSLVGDSRSALKGTGFEFDQIREYQSGDDVRFIDWKASSRHNNLLVKQYIEERIRTILLAVDVSQSSMFGSGQSLKHDICAQVASILALVAASGKDRCGLILFSDQIEYIIPPGRGEKHAHTIMEALFSFKPQHCKTSMNSLFNKLSSYPQKDAIVFVISDFIDPTLSHKIVSLAARKHDIYAVRCLDSKEKNIDSFGFLYFVDPETGESIVVDARKNNSSLQKHLRDRIIEQNKYLKKTGMSIIEIDNTQDFFSDLILFLRRRMQY